MPPATGNNLLNQVGTKEVVPTALSKIKNFIKYVFIVAVGLSLLFVGLSLTGFLMMVWVVVFTVCFVFFLSYSVYKCASYSKSK